MITLKLGEILARYKVTGAELAREMDVKESTVSNWRRDKQTPTLQHLDEILIAISKVGDKDRLKARPLVISDAIEWHTEDCTNS